MHWYQPSWLTLAVDALAAYRLARLVAVDEITSPARAWVYRRKGYATLAGDFDALIDEEMRGDPGAMPRLVFLVRCVSCVVVWTAAVAVAARMLAPTAWDVAGSLLAVAGLATLVHAFDRG